MSVVTQQIIGGDVKMSKAMTKAIKYFLFFSITPAVGVIIYFSFKFLGIDIAFKYIIYLLILILFVKIIIVGVVITVLKKAKED
ncbi:MAG: hypothetical protein ACYCY0_07710 [Acidithiobacillus ferrivorans]